MSKGPLVVLSSLLVVVLAYGCATGVENPGTAGDDDDNIGGAGAAGGSGGDGASTSTSATTGSTSSSSVSSGASVSASSSSTGGIQCGNGMCEPGETCQSCQADCGQCCGNGLCDFGETCQTCIADCGPDCCTVAPPGDPTGPTILVFANYDGGQFTISMDANIPNVVIGLVSYVGMSVDIVGPFVGNVTAVHYAGYDDMPGTTVSGVMPGLVTISPLAPVTLNDPAGDASMICQYQGGCANQGGCNTSAQVKDYFQQKFSGVVASHTCQYDAYMGTLSTNVASNCP